MLQQRGLFYRVSGALAILIFKKNEECDGRFPASRSLARCRVRGGASGGFAERRNLPKTPPSAILRAERCVASVGLADGRRAFGKMWWKAPDPLPFQGRGELSGVFVPKRAHVRSCGFGTEPFRRFRRAAAPSAHGASEEPSLRVL